MSIQALDNTTPSTATALLTRPTGGGFEQRLSDAKAQAAGGLNPEKAKTLRKAAQQLVAITFVQPMLAKMRQDPFKTDLFHGGQAEEIFGQQLDTIYSERIVARANFSIVDAVYKAIADSAAKTTSVDRSA